MAAIRLPLEALMALAEQNPPADPSEAQNLDDFLCFAIYSTNLAVNRLNKPVLDELGLTYLQYIVLVALYEQDDQTVGGLGDKLFLDSSTLTPLLKRLETMGHLTRQRDREDERQVRVRLTPQGRSVRERAFAFRTGVVKAMGLSPAGFQHLREQMVKLRANVLDAVRENR
jgi:MarR family transcriptional regulator, organic hydroperoxide resistance regulator